MIREDNETLRKNIANYKNINDDYLTVRAVKHYIDGALGSYGAWLLTPYNDLPASTGINIYPVEELEETAQIAIENDFQFCVHAIGDRANREVLDMYERIFKQYPDKKGRSRPGEGLRWRIEHAQHIDDADIPRFAQLGVIAVMQGIHCTSDAPFVVKRLGEKRAKEGAYPWKKLLQSGAIIANGTDAPVEDVDPIACYYASVTRRVNDSITFYPEQCMNRMEALKSYTIDAAYAGFEEAIKGSISVGKLADMVILSKDILTIPEEEILKTDVLYTIVGGKVWKF